MLSCLTNDHDIARVRVRAGKTNCGFHPYFLLPPDSKKTQNHPGFTASSSLRHHNHSSTPPFPFPLGLLQLFPLLKTPFFDLIHFHGFFSELCFLPRLTKERGLTLFEIHQGLLRDLKKRLEEPVSADEAKTLMQECQKICDMGLEAKHCLQFEKKDTFEGMISRTVEATLKLSIKLRDDLEVAMKGCVR